MATSEKTEKLVDILTRCIYILLQGEKLAANEATDLFFRITRLFQYKNKDSTLRRLTYIGIKALSQQAENVYVVTSSLTNDVNSSRDDPAVRASALRALCQISDASTFTSIERYLRQSVVDRHPVVASAAISSLVRIASINGEVVRRCTNEIQEALNSASPMVQYHALGLRYNSCKNDRLAVSRLISNCIQQGLQSHLATCLLIRIISNFVTDNDSEETRIYRDYIKNHLNHKSEMVEYEAANALINLKLVSSESRDRRAAVSHLRNFLTSHRPALRFAAVRSLNRLAVTEPAEVRMCNLDLENLISQSDCNRSIAILAITTLLKTGTENSVEKFLKQIGEFLSEIDDGFKVVVVGSVRQLCQKYPSKHPAMMDFLSNMLREDGGYAYKKAIVDTIIKMIEDNTNTKEKGLEQLCEFIEDCEHVSLAVEVLNLLGREGPATKRASTYIRFIANRLLLDASPVACAAITALAKFGTVPELSETIKVALDRFSLHEDYEVMERALFYKNILSVQDDGLNSKFIKNPTMQISFSDLESKLMSYLEGDCDRPFEMSTVAAKEKANTILQSLDESTRDDEIDDVQEAKSDARTSTKLADVLPPPPSEIFDDIDIGTVIKSSTPISLTDSVSEFGVQCIKHIYERHILFQFNCTNTVNNMLLENVTVEMCAQAGFCILATTECPKLAYEETAPIYACVELVEEGPCTMAYFTNLVLKYNYRTVDSETQEPDDDVSEDLYPLEDLLVELADFMVPLNKNFVHVWTHELSQEDEVEDTFTLPARKLELVARDIINMLGMEVHNQSHRVPTGKRAHEVLLGSMFHGKTEVLLKINLVERSDSIAVKMNIRSRDKELACTIVQMFAS